MEKRLRIGDVAEQTGVPVSTIRYYEKRSLIREPEREASSGYRAYPPETVRRLHFIKRAKDLGFTLEEIKSLLALRADDEPSCRQVRDFATQKVEQLESRIEELEQMRDGLLELTDICPGDLSSECPILDVLEY